MSLSKFLIFFSLSFFALNAHTFDQPDIIRCSNKGTIQIENDTSKKSFYKKDLSVAISEAPILVFILDNKNVAKIYPQDGLDHVLLDKKYKIQTDNKTFWKLSRGPLDVLFSCEVKYE